MTSNIAFKKKTNKKYPYVFLFLIYDTDTYYQPIYTATNELFFLAAILVKYGLL